MVRDRFSNITALLLLFFMQINMASAQSVNARVDRLQLQEYESLWFIISSNDSSTPAPDLTPLESDFEILRQSKSNSVNIINGKMESSSRWSINLMPKRSGRIEIPPIAVGNEFTRPITITVKPAGTTSSDNENRKVFIETEVKEQQVYVQGQIAYTVRLLYSSSTDLNSGSLSEPEPENAVVERLGDDISYSSKRGGRDYEVIERNYAIFPQSSGELIIPSLEFNGQIIDSNQPIQRRSVFDPFNLRPTRQIRLKSKALKITVLPKPDHSPNWIPARKLTLQESWPSEKVELKIGEPITRTIQIEAVGLSASMLPAITLPQVDGIKTYPDQPMVDDKTDGTWIIGTRQEKVALIPTAAGTVTLPPIEITWWNTQTDKLQTATLPARNITILPGADMPDNSKATKTLTTSLPTTAMTTAVKRPAATEQLPWQWFTLFFATAWLLTLTAWWKTKSATNPAKPAIHTKNGPDSHSLKAALQKLKAACATNDNHQARLAILDLANILWPESRPSGLNSVAKLFDNPQLKQEIMNLDKSLYAKDNADWNGKNLWQLLAKQSWPRKNKQQNPLIPSLYP